MILKKIKKILKLIDKFSVPISFRYKGDDNYSTALGGIFTLIVFLLALIFGIIYIIPFIRRKNFSLYLNTINLSEAETIKFDESNSILAIGLECDSDPNGKNLLQYLDIEIKYYNKHMNDEGIYDKQDTINVPQDINYSICNYTDFYKEYNNSQYKNKDKELKCIENLSTQIGGHYGDKIFQYYEISLLSKKDSTNTNKSQLKQHFLEIEDILLKQDCKLELHYKDVSIDFNDYSEPIKSFVNEVFLQLNPESILKMNVYYMNLYFENDHDLFFPTENEEQKNNSLSRTEQYFLYKGLDRGEKKPPDFQYYSKIYIRADTKKIRVKRKYQNLAEFYSDTFSVWEFVFYVCGIIFNIYNKFNANRSFEKKLFFFEGFKNKPIKIPSKGEMNDISSSKNLNQEKKGKGNAIYNKYIKSVIKDKNEEEKEYSFNILECIRFSYIKFIRFICLKLFCPKIKKDGGMRNDKNDKNKKNILLKCLLCKKNKKEILSSKATDIMNDKLDITFYIKAMLYLEKGIDKSLGRPKISATEDEIENGEYNKQSDEYNNSRSNLTKINLEIKDTENSKVSDHTKKLIKKVNQHSIETYHNESFENSNIE